jgi:hypothetical protein
MGRNKTEVKLLRPFSQSSRGPAGERSLFASLTSALGMSVSNEPCYVSVCEVYQVYVATPRPRSW